MTPGPTLGEMLLGIEGLALLRQADADDLPARRARVAEMRMLLERIDRDPEFAGAAGGNEYDLGDGYRLWSETYDRPLRLFPLEEPVMHRLFDSLPASVVLDAACGTGRHSRNLVARGHRVIGVDRSPEMLDRARRNVAGGEFREGDVTALPVETGAVDAVVCALALVHVPDVTEAIRELGRVVRPGGRVIISDVHPFLVLLGWHAQFHSAGGEVGFMRLHRHLPSDYCRGFFAAGLRVLGCDEPLLTPEAALTVAADRLPDANRGAFVGLPGVIVWDLQKDPQ